MRKIIFILVTLLSLSFSGIAQNTERKEEGGNVANKTTSAEQLYPLLPSEVDEQNSLVSEAEKLELQKRVIDERLKSIAILRQLFTERIAYRLKVDREKTSINVRDGSWKAIVAAPKEEKKAESK